MLIYQELGTADPNLSAYGKGMSVPFMRKQDLSAQLSRFSYEMVEIKENKLVVTFLLKELIYSLWAITFRYL